MASLQDQLLKAGLVDKNKVNKAKKEKQKQLRSSRKKGGEQLSNAAQQAAVREAAKKLERDRQLNREKQKAADQKALTAQIRQLVQMNQIERPDDGIAYSFVDQGKVKRMQVNESIQKQLGLGRLAIVAIEELGQRQYQVVPQMVAEKIMQRDSASVVQLNEVSVDSSDEDDPYADYQIPDDLMW